MSAKRGFDVAVSSLGLLVLAPAMLAIAAWIRLDSAGPVLFRQDRVGRHGRVFRIHKFRTMRADAAGPLLTVGDDRRVTRAGVWLRRTKLDELPQLWNVLRGDMSLVGPRPEVPHYVALYTAAQRAVLLVRPGLTDPASLAWADEAATLATFSDPHRAYADVVMPQKLELSLTYLERRTVWSDLAVVMRTVAHVARSHLPVRLRERPT